MPAQLTTISASISPHDVVTPVTTPFFFWFLVLRSPKA